MLTNRIITVKGVKCVLCSDDIGDQPPNETSSILLVPSSAQHANIWVNPDDIRRMRDEFPGANIYGLWHTLLTSGLIDLAKDAYFHLESEETNSGIILSLVAGRADQTVPFFGGTPSGIRADISETLNDSVLSRLTLPKLAALLPEEIQSAERRKTRNAVMVCSIAAASIGLGSWATDVALKALSDSRVSAARALDLQSAQVEGMVGDILRGANPIDSAMRDRYHLMFSRLFEVATKSENPQLKSISLAAPGNATVELHALPTGLSFPSVATATPGIPLSIQFSLDGSGDPAPPGATP